MSRRNYRNEQQIKEEAQRVMSSNLPRDPYRAKGANNLHRGMGGEVIGYTSAEGQGYGTRDKTGKRPIPQASRLDIKTPGLDSLAAMQNKQPRESFADTDARKRMESSASGAFGQRAQNLGQRQMLYKDMQAVGNGGQTNDMAKRANDLGVTAGQYDRAWSKIPAQSPRVGGTVPSSTASSAAARPSMLLPQEKGSPQIPVAPAPLVKGPNPVRPVAGQTPGMIASRAAAKPSMQLPQEKIPSPMPAAAATATRPSMQLPQEKPATNPSPAVNQPIETAALDAAEASGRPTPAPMSPRDKLASAQAELSGARAANAYAQQNSGMPATTPAPAMVVQPPAAATPPAVTPAPVQAPAPPVAAAEDPRKKKRSWDTAPVMA
jgi:hypothetical protein